MAVVATLSGARVLLTGGAGLIGSHIAEQLLAESVREIVVFDNLSRGRWANVSSFASPHRLTLVEGDVRDRDQVARAMAGVDVVLHLASIRLTQGVEDPRLAVDVMVNGTFNVFEAAVRESVRRVVFASSSSVYGSPERFPIDEDQRPNRLTTVYASAKEFGERLLATLRETHGLDYVALRPFNVYGPRMDIHGAYTEVLVRWMDRIDQGLPPLIYGDGRQSMDLVDVRDVARAFVLASTVDAGGTVFNVGTGIETSLTALAEALLTAMDANLSVQYIPDTRSLAARRLANTTRAMIRLGFEARISLNEGLSHLVRWWRGQRVSMAQQAP